MIRSAIIILARPDFIHVTFIFLVSFAMIQFFIGSSMTSVMGAFELAHRFIFLPKALSGEADFLHPPHLDAPQTISVTAS